METIKRYAANLGDLVFPRFCVRCRSEGSLWCALCDAAWQPIPVANGCVFCGKGSDVPVCSTCAQMTYLSRVYALIAYADPSARQMLHQWKFVGDTAAWEVWKVWVARLMIELKMVQIDGVCAVPLAKERLRARGFDQAHLIAAYVASLLHVPLLDALERRVHTSAQAQRSHADRRVGEMDGVFVARGDIPKNILICDDVFTSGATMDAAARVLREAGAVEVSGFALCKG